MGKHVISVLLGLSLIFLATTRVFAQSADSIPGEFLVQYKEGQTPDVIRNDVTRRAQNAQTLQGVAINTMETLQLHTQNKKTPEEKLDELNRIDKDIGVKNSRKLYIQPNTKMPIIADIYVVTTDPSTPTEQAIQKLSSLSEVAAVEPNYKVKAFTTTPNDPLYPQMWNLTKIHASQAWDITKGNASITVAVIDSGVDYTHPDLAGKVINGFDFVNNDTDPMDDNGHGTHVSGTIGAATNNNVGISGVDWNARILAIKSLDNTGNGSGANVIAGMSYAVNHDAKVINLSLGGTNTCGTIWQNAITSATNAGVTVVIAAGNDNIDATTVAPANCQHVIVVGATDQNDHRASYSNFGNVVDIAAPGGDWNLCTGPSFQESLACVITSTWPPAITIPFIEGNSDSTNNYAQMNGTSMAAPHVAGVAALMLSVNPNLTPDQIEQEIKDSGNPIPDQSISGKRLNANQAVLAAQGALPTITPTVSPSLTPQTTVTLKIMLQGITSQRTDSKVVTVSIKQVGALIKSDSVTVTSDATGVYTGAISNITPGSNYDIFIKEPTHLQKKFSNVTLVSGTNTQDFTASPLPAGDVVAPNNTINIQDVSVIKGQFNHTVTSSNSIADLNNDGQINIQDVSLVKGNFGKIGE